MGFMGSIYWFLPGELGRETAGIWAAEILFYMFCAAVAVVAVVAVVFIFVQYGGSDEAALWFINQGRKICRGAALGGPRYRRDHGSVRLQRDRNRGRGAQDHRDHHRLDNRPGTFDLALSDRLSGHQQRVS